MAAPDSPLDERPARGGQQRIPRPAGWQPGPTAPWLAEASPLRPAPTLPLAAVRRRLADLPAPREASEALTAIPMVRRASAVLVTLFEAAGEARIILTKRPDTMPSHQGEIAFPGGKMEEGVDADLRATALREAHEEIGLDPTAVEVVAELDGLGTVGSRFMITPFVGLLDRVPRLHPDAREVVSVFDVALVDLLAPGVHHAEHWSTPMAELDVHFFELSDETIWGATARILYGFLRFLVADG